MCVLVTLPQHKITQPGDITRADKDIEWWALCSIGVTIYSVDGDVFRVRESARLGCGRL